MTAKQKLLDALDKGKITRKEFITGAVIIITEFAREAMDVDDGDYIIWELESGDEEFTIEIKRTKK